MMISRLTYVRADEPDANLLGLIDSTTGRHILVKAEEMERVRNTCVQLN